MKQTTVIAIIGAALSGGFGCSMESSSSQPSSVEMDGRRALADPMNFTPDMSNTDVSGGATGNFDRSAFQHDLDDVVGR